MLLAEQTGARVHFCRISSAGSVNLIAGARQRGLPVTADVAIANLFLSEIDLDGFNSQFHMQPPLRTDSDRDALRQALANGVIDAICSDHQPHDEDAKSAPFSQTEPGASTIDVFLSLVLQLANHEGLDLPAVLQCVTAGPARIIGSATGSLAQGMPADLCIVDPAVIWTVTTQDLHSAGKNCPFLGWELTGRVVATLLGGRIVYRKEQ